MLVFDRKKFFDSVRNGFGPLDQKQVEGYEAILGFAERRMTRLDDLAYLLATAWWETGKTLQPVKEAYWLSEDWRKRNLRYYPFYGRGLIQITWLTNYQKVSKEYGVDFVKNPDLVLQWQHALPIMFDGAEKGWFTSKDLDDYIDGIDEADSEDFREFKEARRVVNGTDRTEEIARAALKFEHALRGSQSEKVPQKSEKSLVGILAAFVNFLIKLFKKET